MLLHYCGLEVDSFGYYSARRIFVVFGRGKVITCVCVFTLSCFLAKCVIPTLIVVRYIKERSSKMYEVEMFLGIVFICSMEYLVCFCAASLVGKEWSKETKWRYDRVEKAARIVGRARDCVRRSLAKAMFAVGGN